VQAHGSAHAAVGGVKTVIWGDSGRVQAGDCADDRWSTTLHKREPAAATVGRRGSDLVRSACVKLHSK
jgi:hypothetical protein